MSKMEADKKRPRLTAAATVANRKPQKMSVSAASFLPPNWAQSIDTEGKIYFKNKVSGEVMFINFIYLTFLDN
jgi:hypothetical protein